MIVALKSEFTDLKKVLPLINGDHIVELQLIGSVFGQDAAKPDGISDQQWGKALAVMSGDIYSTCGAVFDSFKRTVNLDINLQAVQDRVNGLKRLFMPNVSDCR